MRTIRIANCSGFYGDRISAAREMIDGGPIDVLTGDWLAELTMGILLRQYAKDPHAGYARTFLTQIEDVLGDCLDRGIRIVSNAGGLNPDECAAGVERIASRLGRTVRVAVVKGDDATGAVAASFADGWVAPHLDTGAPFSSLGTQADVASAYLGCWGIAEALAEGADVVVTGRVSDASVIAGPAAWHFGWARDNWDALAGAVVAGHVIECGAQATGGNFSHFRELDGLERPGFPLAEIAADGSAVITKHPNTGGAVTVDTVTAQLLYEIDGPRYLNPDVVARFDTLALTQDGPDRVRISGARGEPAPDTVKVGLLATVGYRNSVTFVITGGDVEAKAALAQRALWAAIPEGQDAFDEVAIRLLRTDQPNPATPDAAASFLTVAVASRNRSIVSGVGRAAVETGLSSYPGFYLTAPPGSGSSCTVFWPTLLPAVAFTQTVRLNGREWTVAGPPTAALPAQLAAPVLPTSEAMRESDTVFVSLGHVLASRSGDKGGNATLGVWVRDDATFSWLAGWLSDQRWRELLPQTADLELRSWWLPNLRAAGVTIVSLLGHGVAANLDLDAQAKGLGEYLRARFADVPRSLMAGYANDGPESPRIDGGAEPIGGWSSASNEAVPQRTA